MGTHFRNASWSGLAAAFKAVSGLLSSLLAVRLLGVGGYGHVVTLLSLFVLYLALNSSVFTMLVVKLMALSNDDEEDKANSSSMFAAAVMFSGISIALLAVVTFLLMELAPRLLSLDGPGDAFNMEIRKVILLMGVLTAIQIVTALQSALIESAGRLDRAMKWQLIGPIVVLVVLVLAFVLRLPIVASAYVMVLCAGALTDLCVLWFVRRNVMPSVILFCAPQNRLSGLLNLLKSGGVLQATSLMNVFLEPLNKLLLNHFIGAAAVTVYDLAMKVIWGIQYLFGAAMRVFLHLGSHDVESVGRSFSRVIALVGVPAVIFHIIGALFLSWTGHQWVAIDVVQLMIFFSIATVSNLGMIYITPLYISLIGRGDLRFIFRSQAILAVTNVVVSLTLIPYVGVTGAAIGLLSATIYNVVAIYIRCKDSSGTFAGFRDTLRGGVMRYALSVSLFVAAILWGIKGGESLVGLLGILLCLAVIMVREPMVGTLMGRMGLKQ